MGIRRAGCAHGRLGAGFCTKESEASFKPVPAAQRLGFLVDSFAKLSKLPEGARISIQVVR
jgi:hypothetical protein